MVNPILAAVLSFFIPGLGQIYAGSIYGIIFVIIAVFMWGVIYFTPTPYVFLSLVAYFIFCIFMAYYSYSICKSFFN